MGKSGQELKQYLEAGTEAEAREACCLIVLLGLPSLTSYTTENHLLRGGSFYNGLGPPTSIISHENALLACPQTSLVNDFSAEALSSRMAASLCQQ